MFNPQHLSDGTHVLLGHRDGAVYLVTTIPFSDHLEMFVLLSETKSTVFQVNSFQFEQLQLSKIAISIQLQTSGNSGLEDVGLSGVIGSSP